MISRKGSRAEQGTKGSRRTVSRLRSVSGRDRVAITAGTVHPKPSSSGTAHRPSRPSFLSQPSSKNAARGRYPTSSSTVSSRDRIVMMGRKDSTYPVLPKSPSVMGGRSIDVPDIASRSISTRASMPRLSQGPAH